MLSKLSIYNIFRFRSFVLFTTLFWGYIKVEKLFTKSNKIENFKVKGQLRSKKYIFLILHFSSISEICRIYARNDFDLIQID